MLCVTKKGDLTELKKLLNSVKKLFFLIFLLGSYLKARPKERWKSRRLAKPFYCYNTLPRTAYMPNKSPNCL